MVKLVSVLLPMYNAETFIESALQSILTQDYPAIEVIVIDDGSTDAGKSIVERIADKRVKLVSRENQGLVASLNEGLGLATGELVARMDADDIAYPGRIAAQARVFEAHPGLCMLGMNADLLFPGNHVLRQPGELRGPEEIRTQSLFHPMFCHPTVMFDNNILSAEGLRYDPRYPRCEDRDLWRRIVPNHPAMLMPEIGLAWRQSHASARTLHYREMVVDGLAILGQEFNKAGVARDLGIFSKLCSGNVPADTAQLEELTASLRAILALRKRFESTQDAFDRGCAGLAANLLDSSAAFSDMPAVLRALSASGLGPYVSRRHKLQAELTKLTSAKTASAAMTRLRGVSRRLKARRLTDLVDLPPPVLRCLPA